MPQRCKVRRQTESGRLFGSVQATPAEAIISLQPNSITSSALQQGGLEAQPYAGRCKLFRLLSEMVCEEA
jgi:hypothetical protein